MVIGVVIFFMWLLIIERFIFYRTTMKVLVRDALRAWEARRERRSWEAHRIRDAMISRVHLQAHTGLPMIKAFVVLCPLLGLLGTVTGMIIVFDVMAMTGTGNARAMADGVSKATIPTLAGMVGALSGVLFHTVLERIARREVQLLENELTMDH
jgi:biopolymer transport protein ExbB